MKNKYKEIDPALNEMKKKVEKILSKDMKEKETLKEEVVWRLSIKKQTKNILKKYKKKKNLLLILMER
jgi:hypothetical protein